MNPIPPPNFSATAKSSCGVVTFTFEDKICDDNEEDSGHRDNSRTRLVGLFPLSLSDTKVVLFESASTKQHFSKGEPKNPLVSINHGHLNYLHRSQSDPAIHRDCVVAKGYESPPYSNFARYLSCLSTPSEVSSTSKFSSLSASRSDATTESSFRLPISASQLSLPEPPDGGYGWVVVFAAFLVHMITEGVIVSFGVFIEDLLEEFGESMSATSWVGSFSYGIPALVTPVSSLVLNKLGCRLTCMFGALISAVGCLAGCFSNSLLALIFTFGILSGFGFSLSMTAALVVVTVYFDERRATATGLSIAGTGVGALVFAPVVELLINVYSWRGTFMLMTGAILHITVCGALMRPVETRTERRHRQRLAWLEHFAKESGMPTIVRSEEYLDRDVLGRIKLLRDRLLAPRKCFGRAHGVVRMPDEYRFESHHRTQETSQDIVHPSVYCAEIIGARGATSSLCTWSAAVSPSSQLQGSSTAKLHPGYLLNANLPSASASKYLAVRLNTISVEATEADKSANLQSYRDCFVCSRRESERQANCEVSFISCDSLQARLCYSAVDVCNSLPQQIDENVPRTRRYSSPIVINIPCIARRNHGDFNACPPSPPNFSIFPKNTRNVSCAVVNNLNTSSRNANIRQHIGKPSNGNHKLYGKLDVYPSDREDIFYHTSLLKAFGLTRASLCRALSLPDLNQVHRIRRRSGSGSSSTSSSTDSSYVTIPCCSWMKHEDSDHDIDSYSSGCFHSCLSRITFPGSFIPEMSMRHICRSICDFRLFRRASFDIFLLSNGLLYFWFNVTYFFMGVHALNLGLSETQAALLFSILGGANMVGEVAVGFLADREWINPLILYMSLLIACGVSTSLVPLLTSFVTLSLYTGIFGMGLAANDSLCTILLVKFVGLHRLTNALGVCFFFQGVANLFGPPTIGYIIDATHSQSWAFVISGIGLVLSGLVVFPVIIQRIRRRRARRLHRRQTNGSCASIPQQPSYTSPSSA